MDDETLYATSLALLKRKLGHGLWTPTHEDANLPPPEIGSVRFVFKGKWVEVMKLKDNEVLKYVQTGHLNEQEPIISHKSLSVKFDVEINAQIAGGIAGGQLKYTFSKESGACLTFAQRARTKDAANLTFFKKQLLENIH
ncbi:hypothetical protein M422DRAFT_272511 [Sphaerobolus stellatus SS14]|uniref:Unplaced genomic scaffold SPHSTscaffold_295, whole genome shotgun sequence n=1 Tax=Sphaerobolus stellatus (strain SS14) TaxID=990650 RepID=A0A0C9UMF1_SPHS4|nr:hypothetical protein M422DRAFT_272511 [Sphaerobolus stellatus SS14]